MAGKTNSFADRLTRAVNLNMSVLSEESDDSDFFVSDTDDDEYDNTVYSSKDSDRKIRMERPDPEVHQIQKPPPASTDFLFAFAGLILGAIGANATFERLNIIDPGCGSVIALLQYVVAVGERLPKARKYLKKPSIPLRFHAAFVILQFSATWLGNVCLAFDLPFAHYLIIKNTNLVFTMLVGFVVLRERYPLRQIMSVLVLSGGIILTVLPGNNKNSEGNGMSITGVLLCMTSTFAMACLGTTQEYAFHHFKEKDGNAATAEALFYTHLFGLPLFFTSGAQTHFAALVAEWKWSAPLIVLNILSSVVCKYCILNLVSIAGSLTTTMALSLSRFLGILLSIFLLSNRDHPGVLFWFGSAAVVGGSISYLSSNRTH